MPIVANYLLVLTQKLAPSWDLLLGRGELLLVSAGIAATAAGELQGVSVDGLKRFQVLLTFAGLAVVCVSSLWFASVATLLATDKIVDHHAVATGSVIVFILAAVTSACCIALLELK